jgi:hypothetical protein
MPGAQSGSTPAGSPGAGGVLIVGGGQAAMQLAISLRELGWQEAVTIAGDEPYAPYQRPPLSKAFLSGNAEATTLEFRSAEHYERERITLLTGQRGSPACGPRRAAARPHTHGRLWFQVYAWRDRILVKEMIGRAAADYEARVLTVDTPVLGG